MFSNFVLSGLLATNIAEMIVFAFAQRPTSFTYIQYITFCTNNNINNTTVSASKRVFDLKTTTRTCDGRLGAENRTSETSFATTRKISRNFFDWS